MKSRYLDTIGLYLLILKVGFEMQIENIPNMVLMACCSVY